MASGVDEKCLRNRAKVERIKAKVKIRFKELPFGAVQLLNSICDHRLERVLFHLVTLALLVGQSAARESRRPAETTSELSFEFLNLNSIPSDQLCRRAADEPKAVASQINSVTFANNRISEIRASAFSCVGARLRILNLRNNKIESISSEAFAGLDQLQVLLLDGNSLRLIPAEPLNLLSPTLRHLNLASNQIESAEWSPSSVSATSLRLANLISLNLKANPLRRIDERAFRHLVGLKTLSLKWNRLERVPQLADCQALLSIDLSYNQIAGSLAGNFSQLPNLIDLYLGHNRLETLEADALVGLARLQVLELSGNNLKTIHASAFLPVRSTLHELNLAHNPQLVHLSHLHGLERLTSFKSYGNNQLRKLPHFPSARLLALTYAYHCCDYLQRGGSAFVHSRRASVANSTHGLDRAGEPYDEDSDDQSLLQQLLALVLSNLTHYFTQGRAPTRASLPTAEDDASSTSPPTGAGESDSVSGRLPDARPPADEDGAGSRNVSELVLWPGEMGARQRRRRSSGETEAIRQASDYKLAAPAVARHPASRDDDVERSALFRKRRRSDAANGRLIDELIWQVKKIRFQHAVGGRRSETSARAAANKRPAPASPALRSTVVGGGAAHLHNVDRDHEDAEWLLFLSGEHSSSQRSGEATQTSGADSAPDHLVADLVAHRMAAQLAPRSAPTNLAEPPSKLKRTARAQPAGALREAPVQCLPEPNAFQPCADLFDSLWLRLSIWLVFLFAFVGNILVIIVLGSVRPASSTSALTSIMWFNAAQSKRHIDVPRFLVINLAVADLLMACYLGLLAFLDLSTLGEFRVHAIKWQYSAGCKLAGFLAVLSSELSVFILAIITLERNYAITNAVHLNRRLSLQKAMFIMLLGYIYALVMAVLPLRGVNDYRKFSICLPLEYHADKALWASWANVYLATLMSINTLSFVLLVSCYLRMYCAIRGSQAWNTNDLKIAKRMSILVVTDFLCWIPLICVAIFALLGHYLVGPNGLKVVIIFILPLNSVANPFLYAITTKKFKRDLGVLKKRLRLERLAQLFWLAVTCGHCPANKLSPSTTHAHEQQAHIGRHRQHASLYLATGANTTNGRQPHQKRSLLRSGRGLGAGAQQARRSHPKLDRRYPLSAPNNTNNPLTASEEPDFQVIVTNGTQQMGSQFPTRTIRLVRPSDPKERAKAHVDRDNADNNSRNQLTLNKATCLSCQRKLAAAAATLNTSHSSEPSPQSSSTTPQQQQQQLFSETQTAGPRIVLELSNSEGSLSLAAPVTAHESAEHQRRSLQQTRGQLDSLASVNLRNSLVQFETENEDDAFELDNSTRPASCHRLRPNSAGLTDNLTSVRIPPMKEARSSCQTILINDQKLQPEIELEVANRSVSACAFDWPVGAGLTPPLTNQMSLTTPAEARLCSCSCDAIGRGSQTGTGTDEQPIGPHARGSRPQSRSINRLVFEPLAKAWSSLQISLQTQRSASAQQQQQSNCAQAEQKADALATREQVDESEASNRMERCILIDDILQMSSPARRRLLHERRMSRSCETMNQSSNRQTDLSSSGANEPTTSSSFYDQHDDQRILLATINQLTVRRKCRKFEEIRTEIGTEVGLERSTSSRRTNFVRCRSWSPALLERLEDYMHQIRSRIPKFGAGRGQVDGGGGEEDYAVGQQAMSNYATSHSQQAADNQDLLNNQLNSQTSGLAVPGEVIGATERSSSTVSLSGSSRTSETADPMEVDDFNEIGFVEWTHNTRKQTRKSRYRLRQQLSGNSETLSAQTVATTMTSLSFDSSTNIPAIKTDAGLDPPANEPDEQREKPGGGNQSYLTRFAAHRIRDR